MIGERGPAAPKGPGTLAAEGGVPGSCAGSRGRGSRLGRPLWHRAPAGSCCAPRPSLADYGQLPPALVRFLALGHAGRGGSLETFQLFHQVRIPSVLADLQELWSRHADEIRAATPEGREPWILEALRSGPEDAGDDQDEGDDKDMGTDHVK
jgi:hypothetical protein